MIIVLANLKIQISLYLKTSLLQSYIKARLFLKNHLSMLNSLTKIIWILKNLKLQARTVPETPTKQICWNTSKKLHQLLLIRIVWLSKPLDLLAAKFTKKFQNFSDIKLLLKLTWAHSNMKPKTTEVYSKLLLQECLGKLVISSLISASSTSLNFYAPTSCW